MSSLLHPHETSRFRGGPLLVAGSIALDRLEGDFGVVEGELGGSAMYFALAASLTTDVQVVAPVGLDAIEQVRSAAAGRFGLEHVSVLDQPTYRWSARQAAGRNVDLGSRDSIYDHWRPDLPEGYAGRAFVGSMRPDRQADCCDALRGCELLAADAMLSYVQGRPHELDHILGDVSWFFCNEAEFASVSGGLGPEEFRIHHDLETLVIKEGPAGVTAYHREGRNWCAARRDVNVVDVTGAGDSLAGGMLAVLRDGASVAEAMAWGVNCASIAISDIGLRGLLRAAPRRA